MPQVIPFISRNIQIDNTITAQVEAFAEQQPLQLPKADAPLVGHYVNKIEGTYDTSRAKHDTDHAIELLYIAYNTTPQEQGEIRVKISTIMNALISAQQESESKLRAAVRVASSINKRLQECLPDWLDVKDSEDPEEIKLFIRQDLLQMAEQITTSAISVRDSLQAVADRYDRIIADTTDVTASSEVALSETIKSNEKVREEITRYNARRATLEALVDDLQRQVTRYEALAGEYAAQAKSAEQRSFWTSLLRVGAQLLSSALPIAAMAISGGSSSLIAASTLSSLGNQRQHAYAQGDEASEMIRLKKSRSEHLSEVQLVEEELLEVQDALESLHAQKASESSNSAQQVLEERIAGARQRQTQLLARSEQLNEQLAAVDSAIQTIGHAVGELSQEFKTQADNLRQMQLQMLNDAEKYENARREQAAELTEVSILLASKRTEQETIELAVRSLNLSVSALKRTKEIVVEMAFFFKSFSDFMQVIVDDAMHQVSNYESAGNSEVLRANRLRQLRESTDAFFIGQAGQWHAVGIVCERFTQTFKEGWSKLNTLSGTYVTEQELPAYLEKAAGKLKLIVADRENASHQRLVYLDNYRNELRAY